MSKRQIKVLVVDDHPEIFISVKMLLRSRPCELFYAKDTVEGLIELKKNHFDLIILDVILPGDSGFKLLEIARNTLGITTPVLVYSTLDGWEACRNAFNNHAQDFLNKSASTEEKFLKVVDKLLAIKTVE